MKEANKVATKAESEELTQTNEPLDEGTRQVLDEYSRKFLSFIQQEKERIRKQALQESEKLLAEADKKSRIAYDEAMQQANRDSSLILTRSREQANHVVVEAERLFRAVVELRDKSEREIDEARVQLQHDTETLLEAIQQNNKNVAESRAALSREFEDSASAIAQALQGLKPVSKSAVADTPTVPEPPKQKAPAVEQPAAKAPAKQPEDNSKKQADKSFVGTINFEIDKGSAALYRRFKEAIARIPGLEISMSEDSSKDKARIVAFASRPILVMNILHQMSLVKSAVADKGTIEVALQETDRWVG